MHVADRIDMYEAGHARHHHQHHGGQRVDADVPIGGEIAGVDPLEYLEDLAMAHQGDVIEGITGECRRGEQQARGDEFRKARTQDAAEQARDGGAEERKEYDGAVHASAFHQVDVFDRNRAAIAEIDDENGKTDGGLSGGDGEHEECEHLAHEIAKIG